MKSISTAIFNALVSTGEEFVPTALTLGSRRDRQGFFNKKLEEAIKDGRLSQAVEIAKKAGRTLTEDEIWSFFKRSLRYLSVCLDSASDALELLLTKKRKNQGYRLVVKKAVQEGRLSFAQYAAKSLGRTLTRDEVETILHVHIQSGSVYEVKEVMPFLNRPLTMAEKKNLLRINIQKGFLLGADQVVKMLERRLSVDELERLLRRQMKGGFDHIIHETALRLPKVKRTIWLKRIVKMQLRSNRLEFAHQAARRLNRKLTVQEAYEILASHLRTYGGGTHFTYEAARFLIQRIEEER